MPKNTGVKDRLDYLKRIIKEDGIIAGKDEAYRLYLESLSNLVEQTNKVYENGGVFTKESYADLMKGYLDVTEQANNYKEKGQGETRRNVVDHIQKIISKDFKVLNSLDKENPGMIDDAFEASRVIKVNVPADMSHRVGGQISDRFPMVSADGIKGFFTARSDTAQDKKWNEMLNTINKLDLVEGAKARINELGTNHQLRKGLLGRIFGQDTMEAVYEGIAVELGFFSNYSQAEKLLYRPENQQLLQAMKIIAKEGEKLAAPYDLSDRLGYDPYRRNDNKNAAMYEMAKFLKCEKLVAKAVPMIVVNGKETIKGTFMEFAEGSDLSNLKGDDPMWDFDHMTSAYNKDLYRDLADLQLLDYICGNVDRHKGNMCYKTKTENGQVKLTGLVAIDNDASFPEHTLNEREFISSEVGGNFEEPRIFKPQNFRFINRKTADIIKNMNRAQLETLLRGHNISAKAIDKAWERAKEVQEVLKDMEKYNLKYTEQIKENPSKERMDTNNPFYETVNDATSPSIFTAFNRQLKGEVLAEKHNAIIDQAMRKGIRLKKGQKYELDMQEYKKFMDAKQRKFKMPEGLKVDSAQAIFADSAKIEKMNDIMKHANTLKFASSEFAKMRKAMYDLAEVSKEYAAIAKNKQTLSEDQVKKYGECLTALSEATKNYIMEKGLNPRTEKGRERLDAAMKIDHRAMELMKSFDSMMTKHESDLDKQDVEQDLDI